MKPHFLLRQLTMLLLAGMALALLGRPAPPAAFGQGDTIPVINADGTRQEGIRRNTTLGAALANVQPYVTAAYAKATREAGLRLEPALGTALSSVQPYLMAAYAKAARTAPLRLEPALGTALSSVQPYVMAAYAKAVRSQPLSFTRELLGDTTPPRITAPACVILRSGRGTLRLSADEPVAGSVAFGLQPDALSRQAAQPLLGQTIEIDLGNLTPGRYFYRYTLTDRSGNQLTSPVGSFTASAGCERVYLPLMRR